MAGIRRLTVLFSLLMLASQGCGFVTGLSGTEAATTQAPIALPPLAAINSTQALANVARITYDALVGGQDLKPYISGAMTAFDVPPLGANDVALAEQRYSQGLPLMFVPQVADMAQAFNDGGFVSLDAFIAAANDQGAKQRGTGEPLTRDYLTQKLADYAGKDQYEPGQVLPAFVLALGKERASRFAPTNPDPLWGDDWLDPLQLTLLLYSVSYSGAGPLASQAPPRADLVRREMNVSFVPANMQPPQMRGLAASDPIGDYIKDQIRDGVAGEVQDFVEVPLDKVEAAQVSVCASLLLYGHKIKVTTTPKLIYHNDGVKPWSTRVDAVLTFQDDYHDNYLPINRWMLENLGNCNLPRQGPVEGKPLEWSVSDGLNGHGEYNITPAATGDGGKASANWQTVPETTPESQRIFANQRDAVGAAIVRAGSLVPGWSGLERIVGALKDTGNTGDSPLTVIYYVGGGYKVEQTGPEGWVSWSGAICSLEQPFTLTGVSYYGAGTLSFPTLFTPSSATAGFGTQDVTASQLGCTEHFVENGPYTVNETSPGQFEIVWNATTNYVESSCGVGRQLTPEQIRFPLQPLETNACSQK